MFSSWQQGIVARLPVVLLVLGPVRADEAKVSGTDADKKALQGTWLLVGRELHGIQTPPKLLARSPSWLIFRGDEVITKGPKGTLHPATFALNPAQNPKAIDTSSKLGTNKGIYKIEGDHLTICWGTLGCKDRPTVFRTTADQKDFILLLLRRVKP